MTQLTILLATPGHSMGGTVALSFRNIFVYDLEQKLFIKGSYNSHIIKYWRFVDNVLIIWKGTETEFHQMIEEANQKYSTIKFTSEISASSINFLDVNISVHGQQIVTQIFSNTTVRNTLLSCDSFHNPNIINAIPKGRSLRDILCPSNCLNKTTRFMGTTKKGTFPCLSCICCSSIMKGNTVSHPTKGTPHKVERFSTCDTKYVVYMLKCPCEHRNNIRNFKIDIATDTSVSRNFYNEGHNNYYTNGRHIGLNNEYSTLAPIGLNDYWSLSPFL
ncbi:hypothetical protein XELAEV_18024634mg [Xenopus laevis]|uniref:Reverse transcriptase domain-containing protein n=1 Tax=Xenopus laevis TaxID=8355 RepID=A0A974CZ81_XENLA|nr:hypothetical protein XELAEV_18024634mg [Xenopus laevis]